MFFDEEFNGIVPIEIIIDTKRKGGTNSLSTLKRIDKLEAYIDKVLNFPRQYLLLKELSLLNKPITMEIQIIINFPPPKKIVSYYIT